MNVDKQGQGTTKSMLLVLVVGWLDGWMAVTASSLSPPSPPLSPSLSGVCVCPSLALPWLRCVALPHTTLLNPSGQASSNPVAATKRKKTPNTPT
ncbi:hypothetical protein F4775DRAFT_343658 [Biscogniauxia sp. FL1348]|nr:hypothetical protein F4775DRAFT_343658 [Biscogniauxia sp. FL1348]